MRMALPPHEVERPPWLCLPSPARNDQDQQHKQKVSLGESSRWLPRPRLGAQQLEVRVESALQTLSGLAHERGVVPDKGPPGHRRRPGSSTTWWSRRSES